MSRIRAIANELLDALIGRPSFDVIDARAVGGVGGIAARPQ
jgi:hypothetical protein